MHIRRPHMKVLSIDPGLKHLCLCLMEGNRVLHWQLLDLLNGATTKKMPSVELTIDRMIAQLDSVLPSDKPNVVLVEKQPHANSRMRVIEAALLTYFKCKSFEGARTYSPRYKLKGQTNTTTYAARKSLSVKLVKEMLETDMVIVPTDLKQQFSTSKKLDDFADVLLMCLHFQNIAVPVFA